MGPEGGRGALEALTRSNPTHFVVIQKILAEAGVRPDAGQPQDDRRHSPVLLAGAPGAPQRCSGPRPEWPPRSIPRIAAPRSSSRSNRRFSPVRT
jgi:hypothetical protein